MQKETLEMIQYILKNNKKGKDIETLFEKYLKKTKDTASVFTFTERYDIFMRLSQLNNETLNILKEGNYA